MEDIQEALRLTGATIEEINLQPTDKEPKAVLVITAPLAAELAQQLDCREMFFDGNGVPRAFEGAVGLTHLLKDRVVETELTGPLFADLAHKFRIGHSSDTELTVTIRLHFTGTQALQTLLSFFETTNKQPFDVTIAPEQGSLFEEEQAAASE